MQKDQNQYIKNNRQCKTENNCNTSSICLWEETDTICYFEEKNILQESEILIVMRKGEWQKNSWLNVWEKSGTEGQVLFWRHEECWF